MCPVQDCLAKPTFIHAVEACTRSMGLFALGVLRGQREVESDWLRDFHADRWVSIGVSTLRQSLKQLPCPMHLLGSCKVSLRHAGWPRLLGLESGLGSI
jgi:hypothetical protein